ncbi:hypothetical protein [Marinobacter sp. BSs20148]|uniref:hypothetical protein n=1 Tax=Marinobacter sp. BSs20148 TaxID=490759 RepID=UPI0002776A78|nr:hypothetical protein [Marinobacter sp. BSs20148]AFP31170.1 hypothetical protein MRBBS_2233 [Marinobacter sp. BSs20148]
MADLFRFAKTKRWYPSERDNPAEVTYSKTDYGKDCQRMNLDQYRAIHTIAPHRAPTRRVRAGGREHWTS